MASTISTNSPDIEQADRPMPCRRITTTTTHPTHPYHRTQQISSFFPDELYQGYITGLPGGKWFTLQLPFRDMTLTRLGRLSYVQRDLDGSFTLESIGGFVAGLGAGWFWTCFGGGRGLDPSS